MASERMRALLDSLGTVKGQALERLRTNSPSPAAGRDPLGLRFSIGARVLDLVTGDRGVVQWSGRDALTNQELFRVQLADASVQWRSREQLEIDPAPVV